MQRNQIHQGAIVRRRPGRYNYGHEIGRITSSVVGSKSVGYYGKTAATVEVEWYGMVAEDGTVRMYEETKVANKTDARKLEVIDVDKLVAELRQAHQIREYDRRATEAREDATRNGLATVRAAIGNERWGNQYSHGEVRLNGNEFDALVAFVNKVVAS